MFLEKFKNFKDEIHITMEYQDIHNHKTDCIDSLIIAQYDIDFLISHNATDR